MCHPQGTSAFSLVGFPQKNTTLREGTQEGEEVLSAETGFGGCERVLGGLREAMV
jgi:hypothetical protein